MNPHHHHCHLHPPLFVMCPCKCRHHRHYHSYHLHQHRSHTLVPPPTSTATMTPPVFVPPTGGSSYPVQYQTSGPAEDSEARTAGFPSERSKEHEWSEEQVLEEEEEDVFVLTDEWAEFFAKSESKRKLAKKQKRKAK